MLTFKDLFSFQGRIRGAQFAYFVMLSFACALCVGLILASNPLGDRPMPSELQTLLVGAGLLLLVIWWISSLSFTVRRLHDMSLSGWFYVLFVLARFIPFAPLLIVAWLVLGPGTKGPNSFGPDPRAPKDQALVDVFEAPPT